jgi:HAD superfamily hydrolase (TIGR01549 family)
MPQVKAVITDYIGTLTNARSYNLDASMNKLHAALTDVGFKTGKQKFLDAYAKAHEKYRLIRYGELREVTNAIWLSEALSSLGLKVDVEDHRMKEALNVFFQDYIDTLELRPCAKELLTKIAETCKLGLISNFTYAPVVYCSLRKLGISNFFNVIVVSGENGKRKPHQKIFQDTLQRLKVNADETVYIGDSPTEDIKGAKAAGLKTIFVSSQFYSFTELQKSGQNPDFIMADLEEILQNLPKILT